MKSSLKKSLKILFDVEWYSSQSGFFFDSYDEAYGHYIQIGEAQGFFPNPIFDPRFYRETYKVKHNKNALLAFVETGLSNCHNPNFFFNSQWYLWQNPDAIKFCHPIIHYLKCGGKEYRDPSPLVDMVKARGYFDSNESGCNVLNYIISKNECNAIQGVTTSREDLNSKTRKFYDSISLDVVKKSATKKRFLLWVQCGSGSKFFDWYLKKEREWDLLVNYYDDADDIDFSIGEYITKQKGTKFTGIFNVWSNTDIFDDYDYLFFIDDDLEFNFKSIDCFFSTIDEMNLDFSQPSLSVGSECSWPVFFNKKNKGVRYTNGVEIMMPAFSGNALNLVAPYFSESVSGFGLDLLFAKMAKDSGMSTAVVDSVVAQHNKDIDQNNGAYYSYLRENDINAKTELWFLFKKHELECNFYEL